MVEITLPDGSTLEVEDGNTVEDVAYEIGPGLGNDTVAGKVDGTLVAKEHELHEDCSLEIVTVQSDKYVDVLRHTAAHVFAQALKRKYPDARLAIGPWTDDGFYYDIDLGDRTLEQEDLEQLEDEMRKIVDEDLAVERITMSREEAKEAYADNRYKREILEEEASGGDEVTFYEQGDFRDLCKGPHVSSTGEVKAFKLLNIAAAYWRGNEDNDQLTRVYGTAFPSEQDLEEFIEQREEAKEREHRKIGQEMNLFSVPEHSPGGVHYHPNGMIIRRELEELVREKNAELGYEEVWTPHLNKAELWKKTGHYDAFKEEGEMFAWQQDDVEWGLKPMNCANHSHIYASEKRSYRDLPIKLSEFGTVYRNEQSGELSGLLRVRALTQDDGHAYIRRDQIEDEILQTLQIIQELYETFGFEVRLGLETKPDNAIGSDDLWDHAESSLKSALEDHGLEYQIGEGEGAFYGPKISIIVDDAIGREWQVGTVQLDFVQPERLDLTYVGEDNDEHRPVMIHRALLGSIDRFMGVMIEHYAGKFPPWLAPEQVRILPVSDDQMAYAKQVKEELGAFRVGVEDRNWTVGKKIQQAHEDNVPYMLIVGSNEADAGTVSVRDRDENEQQDVSLELFRDTLEQEVEEKLGVPSFFKRN